MLLSSRSFVERGYAEAVGAARPEEIQQDGPERPGYDSIQARFCGSSGLALIETPRTFALPAAAARV